MKKLTLVLLVIASLILGAFTMASCEMPTEIAGIAIPEIEVPELKKIELPFELPFEVPFVGCNHEFVEETKAATCTEDGVLTKTCSKCGEVVEEVIPALGHDFDAKYTIDKAATCSAEGSKSKHCTRCDATTDVQVVEKADHVWGTTFVVDKEVTCLANGEQSIHCEECGAIKADSVGEIVTPGHKWDVGFTVDIEKTCSTNGYKSVHCSVCEATKDGQEIPAGHEYAEEYTTVTEFTCTTDGSEAIFCTVCKEMKPDSTRPVAAHHVFGDDAHVSKPASLYADGLKEGTCDKCKQPISEVLKANIFIVDGANKPSGDLGIGTIEGGNEWVYKRSVSSLVTDTAKYYPTAEDPDGNAVLMELSILLNETTDASIADSMVLRIQRGSVKTNLAFVDFIGDDFTDACSPWIASTKTDYNGPVTAKLDDNKQPVLDEVTGEPVMVQAAERLANGWHRFGFKLRQVVVAKDAEGAEIALVAGQPANPDAVIKTLTYKWIFEYYIDGVLNRTGYIEGFSAGNNKTGIWDDLNLLYKATLSEDGKTIIYSDYTAEGSNEVCYRLSVAKAYETGSTFKMPVADAYVTIGEDFVQKVTPVTGYDFNGGAPAAYKIGDCDYTFPNMCYYQVEGADKNPDPVAKKKGWQFDGWDDNGKAKFVVPADHNEHNADENGEKIVYPATIFSAGEKTFTCEICANEITEVIPQLKPSVAYSANNHDNGSGNDGYTKDTNFDLYKKNSTYTDYSEDFFFEFTVLYNESFWNAANLTNEGKIGGDTKVNIRPFKDGGKAVATLNFGTGNFFLTNCVDEDLANGISAAPDIMLTPGWHRLGIQLREIVTFDAAGTATYNVIARLFVDGELMNPTGTWSRMKSDKIEQWFTATIDQEGKITATNDSNKQRYDNMARCGDFWRTRNDRGIFSNEKVVHYGFVMFDDINAWFSDKHIDSENYKDLFKTNVTPLDSERAYYAYGGNKVVFDLNGGAWDTLTYEGTKVDTKENNYANSAETYTAENIVWFQIVGAKSLLDPAPKKDGFTFCGWEAAVVNNDAKTVTYKAKWTDTVHEHVFETKTIAVATLFTDGLKQTACKTCGWVIDEEVLTHDKADMEFTVYNKGETSPNFDLYKKSYTIENDKNGGRYDFITEFSYFANDSFQNTEEGFTNYKNADTVLNFRPYKDAGYRVAGLKLYDNNFYVANCKAADVANGISEPDVILTPGWHRLGVWVREDVSFDDQNKASYTIKVRLFVDGVMLNEEGTWAIAKFSDKHWTTATKTGDVITYRSSVNDNMARCGDFGRTQSTKDGVTTIKNNNEVNHYGFAMFDSISYSFLEGEDRPADNAAYKDIFKVNVTPFDNELATFPFSGNKVVLDLDGGSYPTVTVKGYKVDTKENNYANIECTYTAPFNVWYQVEGAYDYADQHIPTKEGYKFLGWSAGVVDATAKTVTYKAVWGEEVFAYRTSKELLSMTDLSFGGKFSTAGKWDQGDSGNGHIRVTPGTSGGSSNSGWKDSLATLPTDTKTIAFTISVNRLKAGSDGESTVREMNPQAVRLFANSDSHQVASFFGFLTDGNIVRWSDDYELATLSVYDAKWVDIGFAIDIATKTMYFYINGELIPSATTVVTALPDDVAGYQACYTRWAMGASMAKNGEVRYDNYCCYAGDFDAADLAGIFSYNLYN